MDILVAPCDNFFDFACGNWNKLNVIPADKAFFNTFAKLGDDIQALLKSKIGTVLTHVCNKDDITSH